MRVFICQILFISISFPASLISNEWHRMVPIPQDMALCITAIPGDGIMDTVYAGTDEEEPGNGGVWRTTDGGFSWVPASGEGGDIPPTDAIVDIAIDSLNHNYLVAGGAFGIYITHDGGFSWEYKRPGGLQAYAEAVLTHPQDTSTIFVGFSYGPIYRTTDLGETWETKIEGPLGDVSIIHDPFRPGNLYALKSNTFFISEDSGENFSARSPLSACDLAVDPDPPHDLYAVGGGILRSTDLGWSWESLPDSPAGCVIVIGSDSLILVGGEEGLFRSRDKGQKWEELDTMFRDVSLLDIALDQRAPDRIWTASKGLGFRVSDDLGDSWRESQIGSDSAQVLSLTILQWNTSTLLAGSTYHLSRTSDLGSTWKTIAGGYRLYEEVSPHPLDSLFYLNGWNTPYEGAVVELSEDGGKTWSLVVNEMFSILNDVSFHPTRPETAFTSIVTNSGTPILYRSVDRGNTWESFEVSSDLQYGHYIFDPFNPDRIFLYDRFDQESYGPSVYRSQDGSATWQPAAIGLPESTAVVTMTAAPSREGTYYLALIGETGRIFSTSDSGNNWSEVGQLGDEKGSVRDLLVHPRDEEIVYALADSGFYISRNGGFNWEEYNEGIEPGEIDFYYLVLDSLGNKIFAGGGVGAYKGSDIIYYRELEPVDIDSGGKGYEDIPAVHKCYLSQNHPNPFNPSTTIRFQIPNAIFEGIDVSIIICNVRGKLVRILFNRHIEPGTHQVIWDGRDENGSRVSSGIYLYMIRAGNFVESRKMVLLE